MTAGGCCGGWLVRDTPPAPAPTPAPTPSPAPAPVPAPVPSPAPDDDDAVVVFLTPPAAPLFTIDAGALTTNFILSTGTSSSVSPSSYNRAYVGVGVGDGLLSRREGSETAVTVAG